MGLAEERCFGGDYRGMTWNAQGFFCAAMASYSKKRQFVQRLLERTDFVVLTETHGTTGSQEQFEPIQGTEAFWAEGTSARGGVGIIVKTEFLAQFRRKPPVWQRIEAGRLACLRLEGDKGNLDVLAAYFPTGRKRRLAAEVDGSAVYDDHQDELSLRSQREALTRRIRAWLHPGRLTVVAGDFNFLQEREDRWRKEDADFSGHRDLAEAQHWRPALQATPGLREIWQPAATHDGPISRARLDRAYSTGHIADQLDRIVGATVLEWRKDLSHHRPLAFSRISPPSKASGDRSIPENVIRHPAWAPRVAARMQEMGKAADLRTPLGKLEDLKLAMRAVASDMARELGVTQLRQADAPADDLLSVVMRALRGLERIGWISVVGFAELAPAFRDLLTQDMVDSQPGRAIATLKDAAVELAKKQLKEDLSALHQDLPGLAPEVAKRRRDSIMLKVRKLAPGRSGMVGGVMDEQGVVRTGRDQKADVLRRHWGETFRERRVDETLLEEWLEDDAAAPNGLTGAMSGAIGDAGRWKVQRKDVQAAIDRAGASAPGPDGIPYSAWKALGPLGCDVLFGAADSLEQEGNLEALQAVFPVDEQGTSAFNAGLMVFLPKKAPQTNELGEEFLRPSELRPLTIVNTDNRLMANALRLRIEPVVNSFVSAQQQGFLGGRSLLKNVTDIDAGMRQFAMLHEDPAAIFFDFEAAFPSLAHRYLLRALESLRLPATVCRFVRALYWGHGCRLTLGGASVPGFSITAGIRQGCPLSPLLFALVGDVLLRKLARSVPDMMQRAYADDLAMVVADLGRSLPVLVRIFGQFGSVSGLRLNLKKVVVIPLGDVDKKIVLRTLTGAGPGWGAMQVEDRAKYLGFLLGPGKAEHGWQQAFAKARDRAQSWGKLGLGLYFSLLVYKVYVASVLSFLGQLELLPGAWKQGVSSVEKKLFRALVPGPCHWARPDDFCGLARDFGFPTEAPDLEVTCRGAKFRVAHREGRYIGGLCRTRWLASLKEAWRRSEHLGRLGRWAAWLRTPYLQTLSDNLEEMTRDGITLRTVEERAMRAMTRPITLAQAEQIRNVTQKVATTMLKESKVRDPAGRMRAKLANVHLAILPRVAADRAVRHLRRLHAFVPPRVWAAAYRSLMGGWCTASRFQRRETCLFGCSDYPDRLGHYLACPVLEAFGRRRLRLQPTHDPASRATAMLGLGSGQESDEEVARRSLLLAAAYRVHCTFRRQRDALRGTEMVRRALEQALRDLTKGHPLAAAAVDGAWATHSSDVAVRRTT